MRHLDLGGVESDSTVTRTCLSRLQERLTFNAIMSYKEKEHRYGLYKTSKESATARTSGFVRTD